MGAARRLALLLTASPLAIALATAAQASVDPLPGHLSLQGFGGSSQGGSFSAWLPVLQTPGSVAWVSPYSVFSDAATMAGLGIGYRTLGAPGWALGGYAFIDGSANNGEGWLWQGTLGVEALSSEMEARANVYLPLGGSTLASGFDQPSAVLNSDNMLEILRGRRAGAFGIDGEIGYRVGRWGAPESGDGLRAFAGAYSSWRNGQSASGFQGRLEAKFTASSGVSFKLTGGVSYDSSGATDWIVGAGFRMPLGAAASTGGGGNDGALPPPMDADPVHHLGTMNVVYTENEAAYFLNGRATGTVYYADGDADSGEDGLSAAHATSLDEAVSRANVNGVVVALGQAGPIETTGQTLLEGQALIGGGAYLPLAAADGTTGFSWHADGTQGTLTFTGTDFAGSTAYVLKLDDYNSVIGTKIDIEPTETDLTLHLGTGGIDGRNTTGAWITDNEINVHPTATGLTPDDDDESSFIGADATGDDGAPAVLHSRFVGIDLSESVNAHVANNTVDVHLISITNGFGGDALGGGGSDVLLPGDGGTATGGSSGTAIDDTEVVGIAFDSSTGAYVYGNEVTVTVTGQALRGGNAVAGDAGADAGAGGEATGGAGGMGISESSIRGISLADAEGARIGANIVKVDVAGIGGDGGKGTAGRSSGGTDPYAPSLGGAASGGTGGAGIYETEITGIYASGASAGTEIANNSVTVLVTGTGGNGGEAVAGAGGGGIDDSGAGGQAFGGAGGNGVAENTTVAGIDGSGSTGLAISGNTASVTITATGGNGGNGTGGGGGGSPTSATGGQGIGGSGGNALWGAAVRVVDVAEAVDATLSGNAVTLLVTATGGYGATGYGGGSVCYDSGCISGDGGAGNGGYGGAGVVATVLAGEYAEGAVRARIANETISATLTSVGGYGGSGYGQDASGSGTAALGGAGGKGTGGGGGNALSHGALEGLHLDNSVDTVVAGASILVTGTASSGPGGSGFGGKGAQASSSGGGGGEGLGGDGGGIDFNGSAFSAYNAERLTASDITSSATFTISAGDGGTGLGGAGGAHNGAGGAGTGGHGGDLIFYGSNINFFEATDALLNGSSSDASYTLVAGDGGQGTGGTGGGGNTSPSAVGGDGTGGNGGDIADLSIAGIMAANSHGTVTVAEPIAGMITAIYNGGDGGDAQGGNGGSPGGPGGNAHASNGGVIVTGSAYSINADGAEDFVISGTSTIGLSASASSGDGGSATTGANGGP